MSYRIEDPIYANRYLRRIGTYYSNNTPFKTLEQTCHRQFHASSNLSSCFALVLASTFSSPLQVSLIFKPVKKTRAWHNKSKNRDLNWPCLPSQPCHKRFHKAQATPSPKPISKHGRKRLRLALISRHANPTNLDPDMRSRPRSARPVPTRTAERVGRLLGTYSTRWRRPKRSHAGRVRRIGEEPRTVTRGRGIVGGHVQGVGAMSVLWVCGAWRRCVRVWVRVWREERGRRQRRRGDSGQGYVWEGGC
jgi:hypothetical protein